MLALGLTPNAHDHVVLLHCGHIFVYFVGGFSDPPRKLGVASTWRDLATAEMVRKKSCPSPQALRHKTLDVGVVCPCVNSSASPDHCTRALQVACKSKCPSSRWQDVIASQLVQSRMVFVNVGANKGYRVAEFLSRFWSGGSVSSNSAWRQELLAVGGKKLHRPCGICSDCMAPPPRSRHNTTVEVHALDVSASIPRHRPPRSPIACCPSRSCSSPT